MPQIANITVKQADGTTDIEFTALNGAGGDGSPSLWEVVASNVYSAFRSRLQAISKWNGKRDARHVEIKLSVPETIVVNGETKLVGTVPVVMTVIRPTTVSDATVKEAVYQAGNLAVTQLCRDMMTSGYSAN